MESKNECSQLIALFQKQQEFKGSPEENKLIDHFLSKYRDGPFPSELPTLINILQTIACVDSTQLQFKPLQLLRFCTKPAEFRNCLSSDFLVQINEMMPEVTNSPAVLI